MKKWYIVEMVPGAHPLEELEIVLNRIAVDRSVNLQEQLELATDVGQLSIDGPHLPREGLPP